MSNDRSAASGVLYWTLLVVCGIMAGGGATLWVRPVSEKLFFLGPSLLVVGLAGLVLALVRLLGSSRQVPSVASGPSNDGRRDDSDRNDPGLLTGSLSSSQVSTFLLQELEHCLNLLRNCSGSDDLDRISRAIEGLSSWATSLSLSREGLNLTGRKAKSLLRIRTDLARLHSDHLVRTGSPPSEAEKRQKTLSVQLSKPEQEALLDECSQRLIHATRQFSERPGIREGLTTVAQAVRSYLGLRKKAMDPSDPALAPTLRLPDPKRLELVLEQIKSLMASVMKGNVVSDAALAAQKNALQQMLGLVSPAESGPVKDPTLNALGSALNAAASALAQGNLEAAHDSLTRALSVMRESDALGGGQL